MTPTTETTERDYLAELADAVAKRERAREHAAKKGAAVRVLIREAQEAGVPMAHIARAAKISRARAYVILEKVGGKTAGRVGPRKRKPDPLTVEGLD